MTTFRWVYGSLACGLTVYRNPEQFQPYSRYRQWDFYLYLFCNKS